MITTLCTTQGFMSNDKHKSKGADKMKFRHIHIKKEGFSKALQDAHKLTNDSYYVQVIEGNEAGYTELYGLALIGLNRVIMCTEENEADLKAAISEGKVQESNTRRIKKFIKLPVIDYGKPTSLNRFN